MSEETSNISGDWDIDFQPKEEKQQSSNSGSDIQYMKMSEPGKYIVRLVGPYVKVRKHFKPYNATIVDGAEGKAVDPAWQAGFVPSKRFAINVIDKTNLGEGETGQLKILEKGPTVFQNFQAWKGVTGVDPSKGQGPDFVITVTIPKDDNGNYNRLKTKYQVVPVEKAPFTEEEKAMIEAKGLYDLTKIYKPTPTEKLEEMWNALDDAAKVAPPKPWDKDKKEATASAPAQAPQDAPAEPAVASNDDVFADSGSESATQNPTDLF
jgi:hypothetical protein